MTTKLEGAPAWLELGTYDPDASVAFYTGLFGWTVHEPDSPFGDYRIFRLDGRQVGGMYPGAKKDGWQVMLASSDTIGTAAKVEPAGGTIEESPGLFGEFGARADFVDPSGARVSVLQPQTEKLLEVEGAPGAPVWYELHTRDFAAAVPFYQDVFAWTVEPLGDTDEFRMVTFPAGAGDDALAGIYDSAREEVEQDSHWRVYFAVDDVDAVATKAEEELGGFVMTAPEDSPYGRLAHLVDDQAVPFSIMKPGS